MSVLRSHNNKTRGGLGRVCATGMYRSIEHVKFPKFQTGIFVEWKVLQESALQRCPYNRGRGCMIFGISGTKRTVRNREVS